MVAEDTSLNGLPVVSWAVVALWQPPTVLPEFELSQERLGLGALLPLYLYWPAFLP
jgi:hypothetical protein